MKVYKKYFLLALAFHLPIITRACSVCLGGYTPEQLNAYLITTGFLASMPIIMAGLIFYWIYKRYKQNINKIPDDGIQTE